MQFAICWVILTKLSFDFGKKTKILISDHLTVDQALCMMCTSCWTTGDICLIWTKHTVSQETIICLSRNVTYCKCQIGQHTLKTRWYPKFKFNLIWYISRTMIFEKKINLLYDLLWGYLRLYPKTECIKKCQWEAVNNGSKRNILWNQSMRWSSWADYVYAYWWLQIDYYWLKQLKLKKKNLDAIWSNDLSSNWNVFKWNTHSSAQKILLE